MTQNAGPARVATNADIESSLQGLQYPTTKERMLQHVRERNASADVQQTLQRLDIARFSSVAEVTAALRRMQPTGSGAGAAGAKISELGEEISERAQEWKEQGERQLRRATHRLKERGGEFVKERQDALFTLLSDVGAAVRSAADTLKEREDPRAADWAEAIAEQLEDGAEFLRGRSVSGLWHEVESFGRKRPALTFGACFVAGIAAVRFLKSSRKNASTNDVEIPRRDAETYRGQTFSGSGSTGSGYSGPNPGSQSAGQFATGPSSAHTSPSQIAGTSPSGAGSQPISGMPGAQRPTQGGAR